MTRDLSAWNAALPRTAWVLIGLAATLVATTFVYWAGLRGGFMHDDFGFIVDNADIHVDSLKTGDWARAALSFPAGHSGRWLTMLSFAANYYASGLDPFWLKFTNLCIHLGNGIFLYLALSALVKLWDARDAHAVPTQAQRQLACLAITGCWLLLPINLTAVLYVSQRLESLSNLFVFLGLWLYLRARLRLLLSGRGLGAMIVALIIGVGIGGLAKETAVMLPLYTALVEFCVVGPRTSVRHWRKDVISLYVVLLVVPLLAGLVWLSSWVGGATSFARTFTPYERLLTEARVLLQYIHWTVLPTHGSLTLYHDDIAFSRGVLDPVSTLCSIVALAALAGLALWQRTRRPLFCLGILWFFAGHLLTGTVIPLELVYEHRNYFPSCGLLLSLASLLVLEPLPRLRPPLAGSIACAALLFYAFTTGARALMWGNPLLLAYSESEKRPESAAAQYELGRLLVHAANGDPTSPLLKRAADTFAACSNPANITILCEQGLLISSVPDPQLASRTWKTIAEKLRATTPSESDVSALVNLWDCQKKRACPQATSELDDAMNAAMAHPHPSARLLATYGDFAADALGQLALGEDLLRRAVALQPSVAVYRFNLIQMMIAAKQTETASGELATLRTLDHFGSLDDVIHDLEVQIASASTGKAD